MDTSKEAEEAPRGFAIPYFEMQPETRKGVEYGVHTIRREGIQKIPGFSDLLGSNPSRNKG
jgi:hypothetical protein